MKPNLYYQFIQAHHNNLTDTPALNKKNFVIPDKDKPLYYLYELPRQREHVLLSEDNEPLRLVSHHISFYEKFNDNNRNISCYHYTAYFRDKTGDHYQLHAYFDQQDQMVGEPVLSKKINENEYSEQKIGSTLSDSLAEFAVDNSMATMGELHQQFEQTFTRLENSYDTLEEKLTHLSAELPVQLETYTTHLDQALPIAEELANLEEDNQYGKIHKFLQQIKTSLSQAPTQSTHLQAPSAIDTKNEPAETIESAPLSIGNTKLIQKILLKKPSLKELIEKATSAKQFYFSNAKITLKKKLERYLAFDTAMSNANISITETNHQTPNELQAIESLLNCRYREGRKLLVNLLKNDQIEAANSLISLISPVPEELISFALTTGNAKLLDFLLTNGKVPINSTLIKDGLTPVLYCFMKHSEAHPKTECLAVLIKHKASLMVKARNGLPVAHNILYDSKTTLHQAFTSHSKETLQNAKFIKGIIQSLNNTLAQDQADDATRDKIGVAIRYYQSNYLDTKIQNVNTATAQTLENHQEIRRQFSDEFKVFFESDPTYLAELKRFNESVKTVLQKKPKGLTRNAAKYQENLTNKTKQNLATVDWENLDVEGEKAALIAQLQDITNYHLLYSELLDIQKKKVINPRDVSRAMTRQQSIIDQMKALVQRHPQLLNADGSAKITADEKSTSSDNYFNIATFIENEDKKLAEISAFIDDEKSLNITDREVLPIEELLALIKSRNIFTVAERTIIKKLKSDFQSFETSLQTTLKKIGTFIPNNQHVNSQTLVLNKFKVKVNQTLINLSEYKMKFLEQQQQVMEIRAKSLPDFRARDESSSSPSVARLG